MNKNYENVDVSVEFGGVKLQSPFIVSSGPLTYAAEGMIKAHEMGAGAVVTKTIRIKRALNPVTHIAMMNNDSLVNCEKWADSAPEVWFEREIPMAKKAGCVVIASVGHTLEEAEAIVAPAEVAGADFIELVSYTETDMLPMLEATIARVKVPIICKLSSNYPAWKDPVECARKCIEIGKAHNHKVMICAIDSVGPVLSVDVFKQGPKLGSDNGYSWMSGGAIRPIAMRINYEMMKMDRDIVSYGVGGVTKAEDALEFLMVGNSAVGLHSILIIKGMEYLKKLIVDMKKTMAELGYSKISELVGAAIDNISKKTADEPTVGEQEQDVESDAKLQFTFKEEICIKCNKCVNICSYDARTLKFPEMKVDRDLCRNCGACSSVCPTKALTSEVVRKFTSTDELQNYVGYFS